VGDAAVLDAWLVGWVVLGGEDDAVSFAQAVRLVGVRDLGFAEVAAFATEVLSAGVEAVDFLVACVAEDDQVAWSWRSHRVHSEGVYDGRIPSVRIGGADGPLRFVPQDLDEWIDAARAAWHPADSRLATLRRTAGAKR